MTKTMLLFSNGSGTQRFSEIKNNLSAAVYNILQHFNV